MTSPLFMSSYNDKKSLYAIFEENNENGWLYLCKATEGQESGADIIGDVFICNTTHLIDNTDLDHYKPNLPPITKSFGHPEAVCININDVRWELSWLDSKTILLTKEQKPWALITSDERRGMCKGIKKSGPWGNNWNEKLYKKLC